MRNYVQYVLLSAISWFGVSAKVSFAQRNPMGESAHYDLDRDRDRTSRTIRSGEATAAVTEQVNATTFKVNLNYEIKTTIMGTQSGDAPSDFPSQFFTEQFMQDLRANGHYQDEKLKIDYLGSGNVQTMNGVTYENCDFIKIYDIQQMKRSTKYRFIYDLAANIMMQASGAAETDVEDLEITAPIKYGVPVLGAVKIDVTGKVSGIRLKAGFDYAP